MVRRISMADAAEDAWVSLMTSVRRLSCNPHSYRREVVMTTNQEVPGSCLICGLTWGDDGAWTSWPPTSTTRPGRILLLL